MIKIEKHYTERTCYDVNPDKRHSVISGTHKDYEDSKDVVSWTIWTVRTMNENIRFRVNCQLNRSFASGTSTEKSLKDAVEYILSFNSKFND